MGQVLVHRCEKGKPPTGVRCAIFFEEPRILKANMKTEDLWILDAVFAGWFLKSKTRPLQARCLTRNNLIHQCEKGKPPTVVITMHPSSLCVPHTCTHTHIYIYCWDRSIPYQLWLQTVVCLFMVNVDFRVVVLKKPSVCQGFLTENHLPPGVPVQDPISYCHYVHAGHCRQLCLWWMWQSSTFGFRAKGTGVIGARESWNHGICWFFG